MERDGEREGGLEEFCGGIKLKWRWSTSLQRTAVNLIIIVSSHFGSGEIKSLLVRFPQKILLAAKRWDLILRLDWVLDTGDILESSFPCLKGNLKKGRDEALTAFGGWWNLPWVIPTYLVIPTKLSAICPLIICNEPLNWRKCDLV